VFAAANEMEESCGERFRRREYESLPQLDFSRDILGRSRDAAVLSWPGRMEWSDLGTPERLSAWLGRAAVPTAASEAGMG
jgi:mannose-1-phosphate guanylyltransferase